MPRTLAKPKTKWIRGRLGSYAIRVLVLLVALFVAGCEESPRPAGETLASAPTVVGEARCAACHSKQAELWRGSHHDQAMAEPSDASVLGDFDGRSFRNFDSIWTFDRDGEVFRVRLEEPGQPDRTWPIAYTFGTTPLQQYLVAFPGGRFQVLPVAWDSRSMEEGGARWFSLSPEAPIPNGDPLDWKGVAFTWNSQCAGCHSTGIEKGFDPATDVYETTWDELDVACEACHGPGSGHVRWAEAPKSDVSSPLRGLEFRFEPKDPDRWQRGPGERIARRTGAVSAGFVSQLDVCGPCHSRREQIVEAPRVGAPLLDGHLPSLIEPGLYFDDGQIRDEVYVLGSFLQSRMHEAGVLCTDCHDPHSLGLVRPVASLCTGCHATEAFDSAAHRGHAEGGPGSACVDCHMPSRTYMEIDERRDHSFPVPNPLRSRTLEAPSVCQGCHPDKDAVWASDEIARWRGDRPAHRHWADAWVGSPDAREFLDPTAPAIVRGSAWARLAHSASAGPSLADLFARRDAAPALERLGMIDLAARLAPGERLALLAPLLGDARRGVRIRAAEALSDVPANAWRPADRVELARALDEYRDAQRGNAERPEAQVNLGMLALREGDVTAARAAYEGALARAPYFVPALVHLADLERANGNDGAAVERLREALAWTPEDPMIRYALGLALHRAGEAGAALRELARAAEAAPESPVLALGHALARAGAGDRPSAIAILEDALSRGVSSPDLEQARALLLRDEGELSRARSAAAQWASRWPMDPRAAALVDALGSESADPD